jgi:hypothetical protein
MPTTTGASATRILLRVTVVILLPSVSGRS